MNKFRFSVPLCSGAQSHDDDGVLQSPFCKNFSPQLYPTLLHTSIHTTKAVVSRIGKCEINCILNVILTKGFLQGGSTFGVKYFLEEPVIFFNKRLCSIQKYIWERLRKLRQIHPRQALLYDFNFFNPLINQTSKFFSSLSVLFLHFINIPWLLTSRQLDRGYATMAVSA